MPNRIEVAMQQGRRDPAGDSLRARLAEDLQIEVGNVRVIDIYTIDASLSRDELDRARTELFTDPIIQESAIDQALARECEFVIEVGFRPGVTDNVGKSAKEGIQDVIGRELPEHDHVFKSAQFCLSGVSLADAQRIAREALANELIQQWTLKTLDEVKSLNGASLLPLPTVTAKSDPTVHEVDLDISDEALMTLSRERTYALDLREMQAIQRHYRDSKVRQARAAAQLPEKPTDIELEIIAQTWSEHCKHKIFAAAINYTDENGETRRIDGLFKTFVKATTEQVAKRVDWLVSVFHDNAGIVRFDDDYNFALKCETHNSPSALDPFGGAMTGIVGVNRDILGAGMGCRCIFNTDVFCVASPNFDEKIPERLLHPRRVLRGVHAGVEAGGNQSGIPNVNGAIVFHERFLGKPLVFCGTGGLIPREIAGSPSEEKQALPGDVIVMTGGRIGKDGIHGATFSSEELHEGSPATAVQIGDPITQKKMADFILEARDLGLFRSITDNGAGGLSSSIGEMAKDPGGAEVQLDRAPLKYTGLAPWEIFLSEAQERMTLAVPPEKLDQFLELARRRAVEATDIGKFTHHGRLDCYYGGNLIGALQMSFLHEGAPRMELRAKLKSPRRMGFSPSVQTTGINTTQRSHDLTPNLLAVLASLNVCSKESFVRMYDHEVQGQSVLKQFQGLHEDGPGNAGVVRPIHRSNKGIAIACGLAPKYSDLDCYDMMACSIDEAVRNLIAVGARLGTIAGLDNFCWPDPVESEKTPDGPHKLAQLVRTCEALYDVCTAYDIPLISGKDSMKNDYKIGDTKISIPPTVLFTAAAIIEDVRKCVTMDVKQPGDLVYIIGETKDEMGGSEYLNLRGELGNNAPKVDTAKARRIYTALNAAIEAGLVASCHDCSDGGLAVALAESAFAGGHGMDLDLTGYADLTPEVLLFSESQSRFVVTVRQDSDLQFEQRFSGLAIFRAGTVASGGTFAIRLNQEVIVQSQTEQMKQAWQAPLKW